MQKHLWWRFKNTIGLVIGLIVFFLLAGTPIAQTALGHIGSLGYIGAVVAGVFFVSTFTVVPAGAVLFYLAKDLNPLEVAVAAGLGAVLGDYLIFRFLKDRVFAEWEAVFRSLGRSRFTRLLSTPYFAWFAPVVGALIIASPFPDEVGIGLMGISRLKNWQFLLISFTLNTLGILLITTLAAAH